MGMPDSFQMSHIRHKYHMACEMLSHSLKKKKIILLFTITSLLKLCSIHSIMVMPDSFQISHIRHKYHIHIHGSDVPDPTETFQQMHDEYGLHKQILENLETAGFTKPTPVQIQAVPVMLHVRFCPQYYTRLY